MLINNNFKVNELNSQSKDIEWLDGKEKKKTHVYIKFHKIFSLVI